jgi:hypothetical protein
VVHPPCLAMAGFAHHAKDPSGRGHEERRRDEVSVEARLKLPEADVIDGPLAQHHSSRNSEKGGAEAGPRVPIRTPSIDGAIASTSR